MRSPDGQPTIGVNLLFARRGAITGPGNYAWSSIRALSRLKRFRLLVYTQGDVSRPDLGPSVKIAPGPVFSSRATRVMYEQVWLPLRAWRDGVDLLFSPGFVSPLWGRSKRVVTVPDMYYQKFPSFVTLGQRFYWRLMVPLSIRRAHVVITISRNTANDILAVMPYARRKLTVIYPGPTLDRSDRVSGSHPPVAGPYALVVANITPNKNVETLAAAVAQLKASGFPCAVYVIGEDQTALLASAIERNNISGLLRHIGRVDRETLIAYYKHATCVIHPSIYEGFGLPILEAQAMGVPLISTRGGALPEVAGNGAMYFDHDSADELARALRHIFQSPDLRSDLVSRGNHNLSRFSWEESGHTLAKTFENLLYGDENDA